jgi:alkyl sulfatase BDS1-like metallo-beta-lactamase superfamily hydrolase
VTEGVYVAIGYGLANSIMIEGDTGLIIGCFFPLFPFSFCSFSLQWIAWKVIIQQMPS